MMRRRAFATLFAVAMLGGVGVRSQAAGTTSTPRPTPPPGPGVIKHVISLMQENHTFDNYFGTFPGAAGVTLPQAPDPHWAPALDPAAPK